MSGSFRVILGAFRAILRRSEDHGVAKYGQRSVFSRLGRFPTKDAN